MLASSVHDAGQTFDTKSCSSFALVVDFFFTGKGKTAVYKIIFNENRFNQSIETSVAHP